MIRGIIFDFYGVICPDLYWAWLETHVPDIKNKQTRKFFQELSDKVDKSIISEEEFHKGVAEKTGFTPEQIKIDWKNEVVLNRQLLDYILELKQKYKIGLLSNANYKFIEELIKTNGLEKYFDQIVISSKVGIIKPDPKIFELILQKLGIAASEAIFTDDREIHVSAARKIGIKSLVFGGFDDFKRQLEEILEASASGV